MNVHKSQMQIWEGHAPARPLVSDAQERVPPICICGNDGICEQLTFVNNQVTGKLVSS